MRIALIAVGKARKGPEKALLEHYAGRLRDPLTVIEVEEKRPLPGPERTAREADLLLAKVPDGAIVIALDEAGQTIGSQDFAARLRDWRDDGRGDLAILIGGADGHAETVRARADLVLSLGRMTWPHMLVRGLIAEQLFRAQCILDGHPYHRE